MLLICTNITSMTEPMSWRSPVSDLIFIVSIQGAAIESEWLARTHVNCAVLVPDISVDQTWLDGSPVALQRVQETWNDVVKKKLPKGRKFRPMAPLLFVHIHRPRQNLGEHDSPILFPTNVLRYIAMTRSHVETELPFRGYRLLVELSKAHC
jgi:hypothetical protein